MCLCVWCWIWVKVLLGHMDIELVQYHVLLPFLLNYLGTFVENQLFIYVWVCPHAFCLTGSARTRR